MTTNAARRSSFAFWAQDHIKNDIAFRGEGVHNMNNFYDWAIELKELLNARGWRCHTHDIYRAAGEIPDVVMFSEVTRIPPKAMLGSWAGKCRLQLLLGEAQVVRPLNWQLGRHQEFGAIFTWNPAFVDGHRYRWFPAAPRRFDPAFQIDCDLSRKTKMCVLVATKQFRRNPLELYTARLEAIRWFEANHPDEFDLYGKGWDELGIRGHNRLRTMGLMGPLKRIFPPQKRPSYRGMVADKIAAMKPYRFAICFENAREVPGYVTEKIFDAFMAGCVPVYWGAPDITQYVPENCFIDFRRFSGYAELYDFLKAMPDSEYLGYLERIAAFARRQPGGLFSTDRAALTIADAVTGGY